MCTSLPRPCSGAGLLGSSLRGQSLLEKTSAGNTPQPSPGPASLLTALSAPHTLPAQTLHSLPWPREQGQLDTHGLPNPPAAAPGALHSPGRGPAFWSPGAASPPSLPANSSFSWKMQLHFLQTTSQGPPDLSQGYPSLRAPPKQGHG